MMPAKPLNGKAYGSIPHLPGSQNYGNGDKNLSEKAARFFVDTPGRGDSIIVLEKLDGSCVSIANIDGAIVPLIRSGYPAEGSHYLQHRKFHHWVMQRYEQFAAVLKPGERICGEWMLQAHGTRYDLTDKSPLVVFDFFRDNIRRSFWEMTELIERDELLLVVDRACPLYLGTGQGCSVKSALLALGDHGHHGAIDLAEGCVWRWEREKFKENPIKYPIMMAKYVRPEKQIGCYLKKDENGNENPVWNAGI